MDRSDSRSNRARFFYRLRRLEEAEGIYRTLLEPARQAFPPSSPYLSWFLLGLGQTRRAQGLLGEAEALLREAREVYSRSTSRDRSYEAQADLALGLCLAALGRDEEARGLLSSTVEGFQEKGRGDDAGLPEALAWLRRKEASGEGPAATAPGPAAASLP